MKPKLKAIEIYHEFEMIVYVKNKKIEKPLDGSTIAYYCKIVRQCALVSLDLTIENLRYFNPENAYREDMKRSYWIEVRKELEKL